MKAENENLFHVLLKLLFYDLLQVFVEKNIRYEMDRDLRQKGMGQLV